MHTLRPRLAGEPPRERPELPARLRPLRHDGGLRLFFRARRAHPGRNRRLQHGPHRRAQRRGHDLKTAGRPRRCGERTGAHCRRHVRGRGRDRPSRSRHDPAWCGRRSEHLRSLPSAPSAIVRSAPGADLARQPGQRGRGDGGRAAAGGVRKISRRRRSRHHDGGRSGG